MEHVNFTREQVDFIREQVNFIREMLLDFQSQKRSPTDLLEAVTFRLMTQ